VKIQKLCASSRCHKQCDQASLPANTQPAPAQRHQLKPFGPPESLTTMSKKTQPDDTYPVSRAKAEVRTPWSITPALCMKRTDLRRKASQLTPMFQRHHR